MVCSLLGGVGGGLLCVHFSRCVGIPIAVMHRQTEPMADALHPTVFRADVKGATGPHQHSSHVDTLLRACSDDSPNQIPGLKALDPFCSFGPGTGKPNLVDVAFLPAAMPGCGNEERSNASQHKLWWGTCTHTGGINPVLLWQLSLRPIEFRSPTRSALKRQAQVLEAFVQGPAGGIHRSRILEWRFDLSQNVC